MRSMSSAPTITPSLFIRGQAEGATTSATTPESASPPAHGYAPPPPPERYPKLFFTSAKTGEGVVEVFTEIGTCYDYIVIWHDADGVGTAKKIPMEHILASARGGAGRPGANSGSSGQPGGVNLEQNAAKGKDACNC